MSNTSTQRLEAVRTAIDAVVLSMASGTPISSYQSESFSATRTNPASLLAELRRQERELERFVDGSGATGGGRTLADLSQRY